MCKFHSKDYVDFLMCTGETLAFHTPDKAVMDVAKRFNLGINDCPAFHGLWEYNQLCAGSSLDCAYLLNSGECDIAINWAGGMHHARKGYAYGFCYTNDIVLCALELLRVHPRVM